MSTAALRIVAGAAALLLGCGGASETGLFSGPPGSGDSSAPADSTTDTSPPADGGSPSDGPGKDAPGDSPQQKDSGGPPLDAGPKLPEISCGATSCPDPAQFCCANPDGGDSCENRKDELACMGSGGTPVACNEGAQCPGGVCCGQLNGSDTGYENVRCEPSCTAVSSGQVRFCNPDAGECTFCHMSSLLPGFYVCGG